MSLHLKINIHALPLALHMHVHMTACMQSARIVHCKVLIPITFLVANWKIKQKLHCSYLIST